MVLFGKDSSVECARPGKAGLAGLPADFWDSIAAAACLSRLEVDIERCNMISDILRFFNIGRVLQNELDCGSFDSVGDTVGDDGDANVETVSLPIDSGPYSQVTSQSFNQFNVSGEIVLRLYFALPHVRQDAFSSRAELLYTFRLPTMYRHDAQISSSLQLYER